MESEEVVGCHLVTLLDQAVLRSKERDLMGDQCDGVNDIAIRRIRSAFPPHQEIPIYWVVFRKVRMIVT